MLLFATPKLTKKRINNNMVDKVEGKTFGLNINENN